MNKEANQNSKLNWKFISLLLFILIGMGSYMVIRKSYFSYPRVTSNEAINEPGSTTQNDDTTKMSIFRSSDLLDFSVTLLERYSATEKFNTVTFTHPDGGVIAIDRIGTSNSNVIEHVKSLETLNHIDYFNEKSLTINGLEALSAYLGDAKHYFIYVNYRVYSISTNDSDLYTDLDGIARSFEYWGD